MTSFRVPARLVPRRRLSSQRGVIMILTLVALVLLLIGVAATLRSTDNATAVIGNLAFRRDETNRAEVAIATAKAALNVGGAIYSTTARQVDAPTSNYSASRLANATSIGVPVVLLSDTAYASAGYKCLPASCSPGTDGVTLRWVIDRQCVLTVTAGTAQPFGNDACSYLKSKKDGGGSSQNGTKPEGAGRALYRISVRVSGPRNTESYIQTTAG